ncbi:hypothetical protein [Methylorubrum populi]|uniref:hypothetical protein n=1 Tax=Methylorubrum TaxID=2282523 RepID=UPI00114E39C3|nr:hypothetical protein [Methylorubrum populi]QDI82422.1 hypothetical protein E8E01_19365 [Methylorubrum populi]
MHQHVSPNPEMTRAIQQGMRLYLVEHASWDRIAEALRTVPAGRQQAVHKIGLEEGFCGAAKLVGDAGALLRWRRGLALYRGMDAHAVLDVA